MGEWRRHLFNGEMVDAFGICNTYSEEEVRYVKEEDLKTRPVSLSGGKRRKRQASLVS